MENEYNYEKIDAYLEGKLEGEELNQFEQNLQKDDELTSNLEWVKSINLGVQKYQKQASIRELLELTQVELEEEGVFDTIPEYTTQQEITSKGVQKAIRNNIRAELKETHQNLEKEDKLVVEKGGQVRTLNIRRYWVAAAMIGILLMAGLFYLPSGQEDVFASNFEPFEDVLSEDVEIVLSERGAALDIEALEKLQLALKDYANEDYAKVIPVFEGYLESGAKDYKGKEVKLYLAISQLGIGKTSEAIQNLTKLANDSEFRQQMDAQWYLALAYIKNDNKMQAKKWLEGLTKQPKYTNKANKILEELE